VRFGINEEFKHVVGTGVEPLPVIIENGAELGEETVIVVVVKARFRMGSGSEFHSLGAYEEKERD
jgi:hypothetical protein